MDRLYAAGQTDLIPLLQVRQRLIEAENALSEVSAARGELCVSGGCTRIRHGPSTSDGWR